MKLSVAIFTGMLMVGCGQPAVMQPAVTPNTCTCEGRTIEQIKAEKDETPCWDAVKDGASDAYKAGKGYLHEITAPDEE